MTSVRKRFGALVATLVVPLALLVVPSTAGYADGEPEVSIDGTICWEGMGSNRNERPFVTLTLSTPSSEEVVVVLSTKDGTAKAPDDYRGFSELVVTIPPKTQSVRVPLDIVDDTEREPDEWFMVRIDAAWGAAIGKGEARVIIKDDDLPQSD